MEELKLIHFKLTKYLYSNNKKYVLTIFFTGYRQEKFIKTVFLSNSQAFRAFIYRLPQDATIYKEQQIKMGVYFNNDF